MDKKDYLTRVLRMGCMLYAILASAFGTLGIVAIMIIASGDITSFNYTPFYIGLGAFCYGTSAIALLIRAIFIKKVREEGEK
ncbi:hypothetical protein H7K20_25365 [Priestia aryabhattai]|uniref:Uncharacterized protein n=1 Tax=Priestia aryabhattai TaxID=412384 RepID=A0ABD7WWU7_PRIAR|nr:hypothetical protein [Priestia aryabhattai]MBY0030412.1 hypothetical protein [Priestia aryabhattai]WEA44748.1 hypothetical protein PWO00_01760 [Priestia aryabhattai]